MSDHIEINGKKYFEESYLELANNNTRRAKDRIIELEAENESLLRRIGSVEMKDHLQTIDERDAAEETLSQAYYLITGRSPQWSNMFGYQEALQDIDDAQRCLRAEVKWQLITPDNLPKDGNEVGGFDNFPYVLDIVTYAVIKDHETWRSRSMTHFRSLNAPDRKS